MIDELRNELERAALEAFALSAERHRGERFYCAALYTCRGYTYVCDLVSTIEGLHRATEGCVGHYPTFERALQALKWSPCDSPYHLEYEPLFDRSTGLLIDIWDATPDDAHDRVYREIHGVFIDVLRTVRAARIFPADCLITLLAGDQSDEARLVNAEAINDAALSRALERELALDAERLARLRQTRWPAEGWYEP